jgi:urease accessory protein UreF
MDGSKIMQARGNQSSAILDIGKDLRTAARQLHPPVLLAVVAATWAMGLDAEMIATGIATFEPAQSRKLRVPA